MMSDVNTLGTPFFGLSIGDAGPSNFDYTGAAGANGPAGPTNVDNGGKVYFNDIIPTKDIYVKNMFKKIDYKYDENKYVQELATYINKTYGEHYSQNKFQATEFIIDSGHGTGFCMGNVMKYAQRYGKKGSRDDWRKDLMKVIHYAMMQLYVHDNEGTK
jgi:Protein of unknwon function (DUF3310)